MPVTLENLKALNKPSFAFSDREIDIVNKARNARDGILYEKFGGTETGILVYNNPNKCDGTVIELPAVSNPDTSPIDVSINKQLGFFKELYTPNPTQYPYPIKILAPYKLDGWHWNTLEIIIPQVGNVTCKRYDTDGHSKPVEASMMNQINKVFSVDGVVGFQGRRVTNQVDSHKQYNRSIQYSINCGLGAGAMMHDLKFQNRTTYDELETILAGNAPDKDQKMRDAVSQLVVDQQVRVADASNFCKPINENAFTKISDKLTTYQESVWNALNVVTENINNDKLKAIQECFTSNEEIGDQVNTLRGVLNGIDNEVNVRKAIFNGVDGAGGIKDHYVTSMFFASKKIQLIDVDAISQQSPLESAQDSILREMIENPGQNHKGFAEALQQSLLQDSDKTAFDSFYKSLVSSYQQQIKNIVPTYNTDTEKEKLYKLQLQLNQYKNNTSRVTTGTKLRCYDVSILLPVPTTATKPLLSFIEMPSDGGTHISTTSIPTIPTVNDAKRTVGAVLEKVRNSTSLFSTPSETLCDTEKLVNLFVRTMKAVIEKKEVGNIVIGISKGWELNKVGFKKWTNDFVDTLYNDKGITAEVLGLKENQVNGVLIRRLMRDFEKIDNAIQQEACNAGCRFGDPKWSVKDRLTGKEVFTGPHSWSVVKADMVLQSSKAKVTEILR